MKFDQATGLCGGVEVPSVRTPSAASARRWKFLMRSGYRAMTELRISGSIPSMPSTTTRWWSASGRATAPDSRAARAGSGSALRRTLGTPEASRIAMTARAT